MKIAKIIVINLIIFILLLFIVELFIGNKDAENKQFQGVRNVILREHPPTSNTILENSKKEKNTLKVDSDGFIIGPNDELKNNNPVDVIFFGGSTTECLFIPDSIRFPYLIQDKMSHKLATPVRILNGGVSGSNSMHSNINLLAKGVPLNPKIVVLMHNVNDLSLLSKTGSYWKSPSSKSLIQSINFKKESSIVIKIFLNKYFPNLYREFSKIMYDFQNKKTDEWHGYRYKNIIEYETIEKEFEKSLLTFVKIAQAHNIEVVLMTQFNRINTNDEVMISKQNYFKGNEISMYVKKYQNLNNKIREIAKAEKVGLIDLAELVPSNKEYIYDQVHLTPKGSKLVSNIVSNYLLSNYSTKIISKK